MKYIILTLLRLTHLIVFAICLAVLAILDYKIKYTWFQYRRMIAEFKHAAIEEHQGHTAA